MASAPVILEAVGLTKKYATNFAVRNVSIAVKQGSCFGLLGPNGAGKTTTIEMLEGLQVPTSGDVRFRNRPLDQEYRETVGILFQSTDLQGRLTVREHLWYFSALYRKHRDVRELIDICQLGEVADREQNKLSGGQRQRLLLAIAMVNDPTLIFLDEPTIGLDPQARLNFLRIIHRIKADRKTIVVTTHNMEEAYELCDEVAIIDRGSLILQGNPRDLLEERYDHVVLELPTSEASKLSGQKIFKAGEDVSEIFTADVDGTIRGLLDAGARLDRLRIRPQRLEDLFLEITRAGSES